MTVNFEFLGQEPIENVITCMNYKMDKVVYFGYDDVIKEQRKHTEDFLKKHCGVETVSFFSMSRHDLKSVLKTMRAEIQRELDRKSRIYFDVTGGESLILVAFGMLCKEFDTPMHSYNIEKNELIELNDGSGIKISKDGVVRKVQLTLDLLIEMRGGKINYNLHKGIKTNEDADFTKDVEKIYQVAQRNWDLWNPFSDFLRSSMYTVSENLTVNKSTSAVIQDLSEENAKLRKVADLNEMLDELAAIGVLLDVEHSRERYAFRYKNQKIKDCLWEGGSILEMHTYQQESKQSDECSVGVHLDWDGVIHPQWGVDVVNEIDVLSLKGNIPTFISCKSGKMGSQQALHALYELDTVTRRFGGKYAKKALVTANGLTGAYRARAEEMGIEVR